MVDQGTGIHCREHLCSVNAAFQKDNYFGLGFIAK